MKFFFDNNLPPAFARGMAALSKREPDIHEVIHLTDRFAPNEKDPIWIPALVADGPWYIVSIDKFKKDHRAEREAIARAGHTVYVLDAQWGHHEYWLKAARLVLWWPLVVSHARISAGGVFRIPWQHKSQSRLQAI